MYESGDSNPAVTTPHTPCPDDETLLAFAEGVASRVGHAETELHLDECAACRMVVAAVAGSSEEPATQSPAPTGMYAGRYRLEHREGAGTMGVVYRAWDPRLARPVAVKVLNAQWARRPSARFRLAREARALAQLSDVNVLPIYDVGPYRDGLFIAMEFVDGLTLDAWYETRSRDEIVSMFIRAGRGLAAAHEADLIHRDFKPTNVLIGADQRPRVADFGLVATAGDKSTTADEVDDLERTAKLTRVGSLVGTPRYMAPEQLRGEPAVTASDQFAFCVSLYEALYGRPPFVGTTPRSLIASILEGPAAPDARMGDRRLFALLAKGMQSEPRARHESLRHLVEALERTQRRRRPRIVAMTAAAVVTLGCIATGIAWNEDPCRADSSLLQGQGLALAQIDRRLRERESAHLASSVSQEVSAYAKSWSSVYTPSCRRTQESGAVSSASLECLETRRIDFEQSLSMLSRHDTSARTALSILGEVGDPRSCIAPPATARETGYLPGLRLRIHRGRETLSGVHILYTAGRVEEAWKKLEEAWPHLVSLPVPSLQIRAALLRGTLQSSGGRPEAGVATLEGAFSGAMRHGLDTLALRSATRLMLIHINELQDVDGALHWDEEAGVLAQRPGSRLARAGYYKEHARILLSQRKLDDALEAAERGLDLASSAGRHASIMLPSFHALLGGLHLHRQHPGRARFHYEQLLDGYVEQFGSDHPNIASAYLGLAQSALAEADYEETEILVGLAEATLAEHFAHDSWQMGTLHSTRARLETERGNFDAALEQQQRLLLVQEQQGTPSERRLRSTLRAMSLTLERAGDHAGSLALRERVLVLAESADGSESFDAALSLNNVAAARLRLGRLDDAEVGFQRSLEILERVQGSDAPICAYPLSGLGEVFVERGQASRAIPPLERALALSTPDTSDWATTAMVLARALWQRSSHRDTERALTLAKQAEQVLSEAPAYVHEHEQVSSWLETL